MGDNPYDTDPLWVAVVDPHSGRYLQAFFFLGNAPRKVLAAARRGRPARGDPRRFEWSGDDAEALRGYYGRGYASKLNAEDPPRMRAANALLANRLRFFTGGAAAAGPTAAGPSAAGPTAAGSEAHGGDEPPPSSDFDVFDEVAAETADAAYALSNFDKAAAEEDEPPVAAIPRGSARPPVYTDMVILPDDTVYDLRRKVEAATEIGFYRQHFFYFVNDEGPTYPYRVSMGGVPVAVNWRGMVVPATAAEPATVDATAAEATTAEATVDASSVEATTAEAATTESILGLTIDRSLEEGRTEVVVEALDTFTGVVLGGDAGTEAASPAAAGAYRINKAYIVDLYQVVDPGGSAEVLSDKYTFGLLYHGGVVKYWPQLSMEACRTALGAPREMPSRFPSLVATGARAVARFAEEARLAALARRWRPESSRGGREPLAVTAAAIRVGAAGPRTVLNVRNVFDWIPTVAAAKTAPAPSQGPALAVLPTAASVKFDPGVGGLAGAAGAAGSGGDSRRRLVQKRNLLSYSGQHAPFVEAFLAQDTPLGSVGFAIPREVPPDRLAGARPYAVAVLHASGAYEVRSAWSSDERRGLDTVVEELRELSAPLVGAVNAMGAAAFPLGGELGEIGTAGPRDSGPRDSGPRDSGPRAKRAQAKTHAAAATFSGLTISAFWPDAFSAQDFKRLKAGLVDYERAGLIEARALAQGNTFSFGFLKGVTAYDRRLAQRAAAGDGGGGGNQYAWLCEPTAAARWAVSFSGRQVRFHHRATDLRVEIVGAASLAEFQRIRQYVFSYLEGMRRSAAAAPGAAGVAPVPPGGTASSATLRRLQERDPNLFDQKKYDQGTKVYSIVCQSKHQPTIYSPEEARTVKRKLTPYWNFTTQEPAYYSCPNPEYPHLTLRSGIHPLGYCLPCCKKTPSRTAPGRCGVPAGALRGEAAARPSAADPGAGVGPGEATADTTPIAHVLSYSKAVPVGRMGEPPPDMTRKLLLDAVPEPYSVVLLGVEQSAPAVPDAGFVYAVAEALISAQMRTPEAVLEALAAAALRLGDGFYAAAGGAGSRFSGPQEISEALLSDFVFRREGFSKFGPGGAAEGAAAGLLRELVAAAWDTDIVVLGDGPAGLELAAPPGGLQHGSCVVVVRGSGGTYPAAMLDRAEAARTPFAERWMTSRRVFRRDPVGESVADSVWERVQRVVRWARGGAAAAGGASLEETVGAAPALFPPGATTLLIDMRGRCYAALVASGGEGAVYVPVSHSPPLPGYRRHYGARPDVPLPVPLLESFARRLRRGRLADMAPVEFAGAVVGRYESSTGLCWYHDGVPAPAAGADSPAPIRLRADPRAVDEAIVAHLKGGQRPDYADPLAAEALERNRSYERFRAEFAAVVRTQRNSGLRAQLLDLVAGTQFQNSESVQELRRRLAELLKGWPADLATLRTIVSQAVLSPNVKARAAQLMEGTPFEFDRQTLARLRGLPRAAIVSELREMLRGRVVPAAGEAAAGEAAAGEAAAPPGNRHVSNLHVSNLYVACSEDSSVRSCSRLALPAELYDGYFELLAADIQNPSKWWLLSSSPPGVFDTLVFIRRSGEHLFVR